MLHSRTPPCCQAQFGYNVPGNAPPPGSPRAADHGCLGRSRASSASQSLPYSPSHHSPGRHNDAGMFDAGLDDAADLNAKLAATSMLLGMAPSPRVIDGRESSPSRAQRVAFSPPASQDGRTGQRPHTVAGGEWQTADGSLGSLGSAASPTTRPDTSTSYLLPLRAAYVAEPTRAAKIYPSSPTLGGAASARGGWDFRDAGSRNGWEWPSARFTDARPVTTQPRGRATTPGYVTPQSARGRDTASEGKALGVGGFRHWEHKEPFELARERGWRVEAKLRTVARPLTKRRPATRA